MRKKLKTFLGQRRTFQMTFIRIGKKSGGKRKERLEKTALCIEIIDILTKTRVCDHLWFNFLKQFEKINPKSGDIIQLDGRIDEYLKGYSEDSEENPFRYDYTLRNPTKLSIIGKAEGDFSKEQKLSDKIAWSIDVFDRRRIASLKLYYAKKEYDLRIAEKVITTRIDALEKESTLNPELPAIEMPKSTPKTLLDYLKKTEKEKTP